MSDHYDALGMSTGSPEITRAVAIRHVPHEGLGAIEGALIDAGIVYQYGHPTEISGLPDYDYLIILGGPWSVYDGFPWLDAELQLIREAMEKNIPILGICLGAQLIATALGAEVRPCGPKEIGWYPLRLTEEGGNDALLGHLGEEETVFQWHGDMFDIPAGAVHLAASPLCRNQAFRYGDSVWALQFHLEVTPPMVEQWLTEPDNEAEVRQAFGSGHFDQVRGDTPKYADRLGELGARAFKAFIASGRK